jgi:hypothetical protein
MEQRRSMIPAVDFEFVIGSALCAHFNSHFCDRISLRVISASQTHCSQSSSEFSITSTAGRQFSTAA